VFIFLTHSLASLAQRDKNQEKYIRNWEKIQNWENDFGKTAFGINLFGQNSVHSHLSIFFQSE